MKRVGDRHRETCRTFRRRPWLLRWWPPIPPSTGCDSRRFASKRSELSGRSSTPITDASSKPPGPEETSAVRAWSRRRPATARAVPVMATCSGAEGPTRAPDQFLEPSAAEMKRPGLGLIRRPGPPRVKLRPGRPGGDGEWPSSPGPAAPGRTPSDRSQCCRNRSRSQRPFGWPGRWARARPWGAWPRWP